ncbi:MAG: hypothetical protein V3U82_02770 [Robiginitomaculum sp.]
MNHTRMLSKLLPTAGLRRSLERLSEHLIAKMPDTNVALITARAMRRIVRLIIQIEQQNGRITLKKNMLKSSGWRARVLRELGGDVALARWEKSLKRSKARGNIRLTRGEYSRRESGKHNALTWFEEKRREQRNAEQRRFASFAPSHPLIFKDAIKVDFEGQFRLAPLPRLSGPRRKTVREQTRVRREVGALKLWGRDTSDTRRRRRPETLNPIALLPRELRGYGAPSGGAPKGTLLGQSMTAENLFPPPSASLTPPPFDIARAISDGGGRVGGQSLIRAGPLCA